MYNYRALNKDFFEKHQNKLLWLLNNRLTCYWFRYILRIHADSSSVGNNRIDQILPHAIRWGNTWEFRTHEKYGKRLYFAFKPLWWTFHFWDWSIADRYAPRLSFGFATLTAYPDPNPETTSVDGWVGRDGRDETWATMIAAADGDSAVDTETGVSIIWVSGSVTTNQFARLRRGIALFDTSGLGAGATVSAATLSFFGFEKYDGVPNAPTTNVYSSAPASNTALGVGDYDSLGTTAFSTAVTHANLSESAYVDWALNASGLAAISLTSISKFSLRNANFDVGAVAPAWASGTLFYWKCYFADQAGTTNDPKLVITYTTAAAGGDAPSTNPLMTMGVS